MMDNYSGMTMTKIKGCLEEIMRNFFVEIDSIKSQFMGDQDSSKPSSRD